MNEEGNNGSPDTYNNEEGENQDDEIDYFAQNNNIVSYGCDLNDSSNGEIEH